MSAVEDTPSHLAENTSGHGRKLKILMLSWEYPPVMVGGLGRHVHALARTLAGAGHEVTVATQGAPGAPADEVVDGVRVVRAVQDPPAIPLDTDHLLPWTMAFNHALTRAALCLDGGGFDLIHAHDWLVTHTAVALKGHLGLPLVATIHSTEAGRHQGWLPGDLNRAIHSVEGWLTCEAERVLVCSRYMQREVSALFGTHPSKIDVIPNGVEAPRWPTGPRDARAAHVRFTDDGPLIDVAGRPVHEKRVQHGGGTLPEPRHRHRRPTLGTAHTDPGRRPLRTAWELPTRCTSPNSSAPTWPRPWPAPRWYNYSPCPRA
jgi:glycogen(starch) synthase